MCETIKLLDSILLYTASFVFISILAAASVALWRMAIRKENE